VTLNEARDVVATECPWDADVSVCAVSGRRDGKDYTKFQFWIDSPVWNEPVHLDTTNLEEGVRQVKAKLHGMFQSDFGKDERSDTKIEALDEDKWSFIRKELEKYGKS